MKYGLFVHYVWGGTAYHATLNADGSFPAGLDDLADHFDATRFADDLAAMKVEYVIFTAWHANMNCLWPSSKMQQWLPGHAARRDVLRDMISAVKAKGIRVLLYTHPSDGHDLTAAEQNATGWGPTFDFTKWNDFINDIYGDLIARYGDDIDGVYIDEHAGQNGQFVDYPRLRNTLKAGNPNLLMLQNDYGKIYNCDLGDNEVFSFNSADGNAWPAPAMPSAVLISKNWWTTNPTNVLTVKYSPESIFRYTVLMAGIRSSAGGPTWAAGNYPGGGWENGVLETMRTVAGYLRPIARSIHNTFASTSYLTGPWATIHSLDWGVATKSTDDHYEYIHVLRPPSGQTLVLPRPMDQKIFTSARLLAKNHRVKLSQDKTGVRLTLEHGDAWDSLDTVIEMTVDPTRHSLTPTTDRGQTVLLDASRFIGRESLTLDNGAVLMLATNLSYSGETRIIGSTLRLSSHAPVPGMARWFDASDLRLTNGESVSRWNDLSGHHADAERAPGDNQLPVFLAEAGTGSGRAAIHFGPGSGLNPALDSQALSFPADQNIRTVFSVFKGSSFLLTDYGTTHFHRPDDVNPAAPLWSRSYAGPDILSGRTYVNGALVDGATSMVPTNLHDGFNLIEVLAANSVTASGFNKDRYCHAGDQCQAEVLIYDFPLTEAQRLQTEAYLSAKWFGAATASNLLPTTSVVSLSKGGVFDLGGVSQTCAGICAKDHSGTRVELGNATLTVSGSRNATFDGMMVGNGTLVKTGGNAVTLSGTNNIAGPLIVRGGTLVANHWLGAGSVTVAANSVLQSCGQILSPVSVQAGGTLTLGKALGTLTIRNTLELGGTNVMKISATAGRRKSDCIRGISNLTYGGVLRLVISGRPLVAGDSFKLFDAGNYSGDFEAIVPSTPANGMVWDTKSLRTEGSIRVQRVAKP